jgi:hypothetical protein
MRTSHRPTLPPASAADKDRFPPPRRLAPHPLPLANPAWLSRILSSSPSAAAQATRQICPGSPRDAAWIPTVVVQPEHGTSRKREDDEVLEHRSTQQRCHRWRGGAGWADLDLAMEKRGRGEAGRAALDLADGGPTNVAPHRGASVGSYPTPASTRSGDPPTRLHRELSSIHSGDGGRRTARGPYAAAVPPRGGEFLFPYFYLFLSSQAPLCGKKN